MKIFIVLMFLVFSILNSANAAPAMSWECSGFDVLQEGVMENSEALTFNLVLAEHDGQDFQWKAMENIVYAGGATIDDIELMKNTVICGKDNAGKDLIGTHTWSLEINTGKFLLVSGCENEQTIIEATCK